MESISDKILAKSINYGGLTLLEHTKHVVQAIEIFATKYDWDLNKELARKGAIIHDLGKAHPHFQRKIRQANGNSLADNRVWEFIHRHEISSLAFLPIFERAEWDQLIELVIAHHKSVKNDPSERGILDLVNKERNTIANHLLEWENWSIHGYEILEKFGIPTRIISYDEALHAIKYVINYCHGLQKGWSPLRGLLRSADHFGSAFSHDTKKCLQNLFEIPDLSFYFSESRKSDLYPLSKISPEDTRPHTLVVAPTGAGKTDFLLKRTQGRIFYTLPFQASINAMWERLVESIPNKDIRLLHATSKIVSRENLDEQILQPLAGSTIKVLTPHQMAAIIFGTNGFETVMLDLKGTDVILDEIHTYSDQSRSMVLEIIKALIRLNCRIHVGTATMPSVLYKAIKDIMGGPNEVYEVSLPDNLLDQFDRHIVFKNEEEEILEIIKKAVRQKEKLLIVCNTIKKAQEIFKVIQKKFIKTPKMLIHSRFKRGDRIRLENLLKTQFNGDGKKYGNGLKPCIVVSTQVVEVSLDISFDRMISECAPLDSMIQRFGRVNRKRSQCNIGKFKPVHVIRPQGNVLPYQIKRLKASYDQLPSDGKLLRERTLQEKIDNVYPFLESSPIDIHLIFQDGRYKIRKLTNRKKAILVEALEIESASCILATDREAYLTSSWEERLFMEIPINWKTISKYANQYEQLEVGSYPFVVPQEDSEYQQWGLQLLEPKIIL